MGTKKQIFAVELNLLLIARTGIKVTRGLALDIANLDFPCSFLLSFSTRAAKDPPAAGSADPADSPRSQRGDSNPALPDLFTSPPFFIHHSFASSLADPEVPSGFEAFLV